MVCCPGSADVCVLLLLLLLVMGCFTSPPIVIASAARAQAPRGAAFSASSTPRILVSVAPPRATLLPPHGAPAGEISAAPEASNVHTWKPRTLASATLMALSAAVMALVAFIVRTIPMAGRGSGGIPQWHATGVMSRPNWAPSLKERFRQPSFIDYEPEDLQTDRSRESDDMLWLIDHLGERLAHKAVGLNGYLMRSAYLRESTEALLELVGLESTGRMIEANADVLRTRGSVIRDAYRMLCALLGPDKGREAAESRPNLLRYPPQHLQQAMGALSDLFGRRGAWDLVDGNWVLLDVKDTVLRSGMEALSALFGEEQAMRVVKLEVHLLSYTKAASLVMLQRAVGTALTMEAVCRESKLLATKPDKLAHGLVPMLQLLEPLLGRWRALRVLERSEALLECYPEDIQGSVDALVEVFGAAGAARAIYLAPFLLDLTGKSLRGWLGPLVEVLGADGLLRAAERECYVLRPQGDLPWVAAAALVRVFKSQEGALEALVRCPPLLLRAEFTIRQARQTIVDLFGPSQALEVLRSSPVVLQQRMEVIKELVPALRDIYGSMLLKAINLYPGLLRVSCGTVRRAKAALDKVLGEGTLRAVVETPQLLARPPGEIEGALQQLVDFFGPDRAVTVAGNCMDVLARKVVDLRDAMASLVAVVGAERASAVVVQAPTVLLQSGIAVRAAAKALERTFGSTVAKHLLEEQLEIWASDPACVPGTLPLLVSLFGVDGAQRLAQSCPRVLGQRRPFIGRGILALENILGKDGTRAAIAHHAALLTHKAFHLQGAWFALQEALGAERALAAAQAWPTLLCCQEMDIQRVGLEVAQHEQPEAALASQLLPETLPLGNPLTPPSGGADQSAPFE